MFACARHSIKTKSILARTPTLSFTHLVIGHLLIYSNKQHFGSVKCVKMGLNRLSQLRNLLLLLLLQMYVLRRLFPALV